MESRLSAWNERSFLLARRGTFWKKNSGIFLPKEIPFVGPGDKEDYFIHCCQMGGIRSLVMQTLEATIVPFPETTNTGRSHILVVLQLH